MQEKYGFVYIWYDRKHKRYYIGCHWGTTYDGYICSSTWMKNSYKRRPQDFKRKILKYTSSKEEMFIEEFRYLSMIKSEEIGKRYYNLTLRNDINKWQIDKQKRKTTSLKISEANKGRKFSEEHKQKLSIAKKGKESSRKNAILSEQTKNKLREHNLGKILSEETKLKQSLTNKGLIWITDGVTSKRIFKDEIIEAGWKRGRIKRC